MHNLTQISAQFGRWRIVHVAAASMIVLAEPALADAPTGTAVAGPIGVSQEQCVAIAQNTMAALRPSDQGGDGTFRWMARGNYTTNIICSIPGYAVIAVAGPNGDTSGTDRELDSVKGPFLHRAGSHIPGGTRRTNMPRIASAPEVVGWGHARCDLLLSIRASDPSAVAQVGQWAAGYISGILALDVESAIPDYGGLTARLRAKSAPQDSVSPIASRIVDRCRSEPSLSVEVASQRVALELAREGRTRSPK